MMTNEDLLKNIGILIEAKFLNERSHTAKLIETKLTNEREHTKNIVKEIIEFNNKIIGTIFKIEIAELIQGQTRIEKKLDKVTKNHEDRITHLERATSYTHGN